MRFRRLKDLSPLQLDTGRVRYTRRAMQTFKKPDCKLYSFIIRNSLRGDGFVGTDGNCCKNARHGCRTIPPWTIPPDNYPRTIPPPVLGRTFPRTIPPICYAYIHTHVCIHTYTYIHTHIHIHTYIHTYIYIRTYTYTHIHAYIYNTCIHIHTYIYKHTYIYICMHVCEYTMYVCMYTYMYNYTKICQYI